ncbi:hypothetical protein SAMN05421821_105240 [Mucilaginibacter lappiensis]|nr:hypothetical protein SAMN05421821_105240 [Mucilaginibacter lappiensis]
MAIFPFVLVKHQDLKNDDQLIRHETIHLMQELELLIIPFYILYLANYLVNLIRYHDHEKAYLNIVFEREAYAHETSSSYLKHRKFWGWLKFIKA